MPYELFQQGPAVYIPILLASLVMTLAAYGMFPLILARARKKVITRRTYNWLCYGVNFLVMILFFTVMNGEPGNVGPYILWTWVFSSSGVRTLKSRGVLEGFQPFDYTKTSSYQASQGTDADIAVEPGVKAETLPAPEENPPVRFCRKCGFALFADSLFCSKCGTSLAKEAAHGQCQKCGCSIPEDSRFCPYCGTRPESASAAKPAVPAAPMEGKNTAPNSNEEHT